MHKASVNKRDMRIGEHLKSVCVTLGISIGMCAVASLLFINEIIKEEWLEHTGVGIIIASVFLGTKQLHKNIGKNVWSPVITAGILLIILAVIHYIAFRGTIQNTVEIVASIVAGVGLSFVSTNAKRKEKKRRTKARYR